MVIQLREIIGTLLEEHIFKLIENFSCKDNDVENFIKTKAYDFEKRNKSRTYLIVSEERQNILAYYTLSLKTLELNKNVSKTTIKEIDGFNKNASSASVILIGQFGKDKVYAKNIKGKELFSSCLSTVYKIHNLVGSRVVMLECVDNEKIINFYKESNFYTLKKDKDDKFVQMIRAL